MKLTLLSMIYTALADVQEQHCVLGSMWREVNCHCRHKDIQTVLACRFYGSV
jgi:hypothetical protein